MKSTSPRIIALILVFLLHGCSAPTYQQPLLPSGGATTSSADACTFQSKHLTITGANQEAGYYCTPYLRPGFSASDGATISQASVITSPGCSYIPTYTRNDGTVVGPFMRCKSFQDSTSYRLTGAGAAPAPCVTSYCGPVSVKGYYRKDGTYVRPHTRKK